jgi:unsaturated rhamnogalacturonyl hydrolase
MLLPASHVASAADVPHEFSGATPIEWSQRLARSEMARRGKSLFKDGSPKARWEYTSGLFGHSLYELARETGDKEMAAFAAALVTSFIDSNGDIATYRESDYNIDMIVPGRVVLECYEETHDERLKTAAATLRGQLAKHPRTSDGGYWHKQRYPWQMWLDGLYMGSPFLAHYGKVFNEPAAFDDVVKQIQLMDQHAYDPKTGLYFHGWDEKRAQSWADPKTGRSPSFWGRAIGWYAMALVDCLDFLPPEHRGVDSVKSVLQRLVDGVVRYQDPKTGLWWQVVDQAGREGNYLESSASSMFVYAMAKGVNHGYLPREKYQPAALKGYEGLVRDFIRTDGDGNIHLTRTCEVSGLGFTTANGRPRDGSFAYYISEPVVENDLKGVGPFILAGMEVRRMTSDKDEQSLGWPDAAAVLARIKVPEFAAKEFPITSYGAKQGEDATKSISAAIDACHAAGGGRVVVPAGGWLTGAIHLKSDVNLHVSEGATLRFSTKPADYPIVSTRWEGTECMNYSALIYASGRKNIAITGSGVLDGQSDHSNWWGWNDKKHKPSLQQAARDRLVTMGELGVPVDARVFGEGSFLRPNFIQFHGCENILIEGVTILRSPMWEIHPVLSKNITVRKVKVSSHGPNNDGCDPECSRDVLIEDCVFDTGDDCIAIKSGRNNDGRRVNVPSENIVVRRCVMKDGHGGVVLGSEISGNVRNVFIEDCEMDSPNLDRALRFKSNARRGGVLENVFMRNVRVGHVREAVLTIDLLYEEGADGPQRPVVRNVRMENITSNDSPRVMWIKGFEGAVIDNIHISNSIFRGIKQKDVIEHAGSIHLDKVSRE